MKHPSIWMLTAHFFPVIGGAERQTQQISAGLRARFGWTVRIITRRASDRLPSGLSAREEIDGTPVIRVPSRSGINPKFDTLVYFLAALWHLARRGRHSIYHAQDEFGSAWLAVLASRMLSGHCVIKLRSGCYFYDQVFRNRLAHSLFFFRLRQAHHIIVVNSEVKAYLLAGGISARNISLVPNGVDTCYFRPPSTHERAEARQQMGYDTQTVIVLFAGRLQHLKGADILFDAWQHLPSDYHQRALLVIVGDGPDYDELARRGIPSIQMVGMKRNVRDFYWSSDLFVLPSRTEGQANALLEAMACGLPCIGSRAGGTPDIITPSETGYLVATEDVAALAQCLTQVLNAPDDWAAVGTRARERVISYADISAVTARISQIYETLLAGSS